MAENVRPVRLQLSRAKGFNLQAVSMATNKRPAVVVRRPAALGNPFIVGVHGTREECVRFYALMLGGMFWVSGGPGADAMLKATKAWGRLKTSLRGKNLACTCSVKDGKPCHAGVQLICANLPRGRKLTEYFSNVDELVAASANPNILLEIASR